MTRFQLRGLLLSVFSVSLLTAGPARAQQTCDANCDPDIGCHGGCSISVADPCSAVCFDDGCGATCLSFGRIGCRASFTVHCAHIPPVNSVEPPVGWALVRYELPSTAQLGPKDIVIVSASSDAVARYAQAESAKHENQVLADRNAAGSSDAAAALLETQTAFIVVPSGPCERVHSRLAARNLAEERPTKPENVYFRATTIGAGGRISSIEVLYTDASDSATKRIVTFGRDNLRVWSPTKPTLPLQVYGSLRVHETGDVTAGALAASSLF
jgi:hypothetical protein